MKRAGMRAALSALLALACSGQQQTAGSSQQGPMAPPAPKSPELVAAPAEEQAAEAFSLERFTPLLALPELAPVARALEEEQSAAAVRLLESIMAEKPPAAAAVARWQFLLARLREGAGELEGAAASYDLAAASDWPLRDYALL